MATIGSSLGVALLAAGCVGGCAITEMRTENERLGGQVQAKEHQLQQEQQTQARMQTANRQLIDDLQSRELTLAELSQRLQELQRLNAATAATTEAQRRRKAERERQLAQAAGDVKQLQQDTGTGSREASQQAKARQLEAARRELRKRLELLAQM